jgi:hypothetical protein
MLRGKCDDIEDLNTSEEHPTGVGTAMEAD